MKIMITACFVLTLLVFTAVSLYAGNPAKTPDIVTIDSLKDKYETVFFTHERHVSLSGNCGACHHQHGNSGSLPCKDCHSLDSAVFKGSVSNNFLACRNCHGESNPATPGVPGLKVAYHSTCFECHRGMGNVGLDPKGCTEICHAAREQKITRK